MDRLEKTYSIATGHINLIQEQRFRIILDDGRSFLLTLGQTDVRDLVRLKQKHTRVEVAFSGEPNLASCIAHAVRPLDTF